MSEPFFTAGHSTRTLDEFVDLLRGSSVGLIVDTRRLPGSTRYPQFDQETLSRCLNEVGIGYRASKGLTGRRPMSKEVSFEVNAWWKNRSFHNYADYALSDDFTRALAELRMELTTVRVADLRDTDTGRQTDTIATGAAPIALPRRKLEVSQRTGSQVCNRPFLQNLWREADPGARA